MIRPLALGAGIVMVACSLCHAGPAARMAIELGLTAEHLAAAGLSLPQVEAVLRSLAVAESERTTLADLARQQVAASRRLSIAKASHALAPTDHSVNIEYEAALQAAQSLDSQVLAARTALRTFATSTLDDQTRVVLQRLIDTAVTRVPAAYRTVAWTPEQLAELQHALRAESRGDDGSGGDTGAALLLAQARAHPEVVRAAARVESSLDQIRSAFGRW